MSKRIFSGIQPSGVLHLGNYLGAIKNWVDLQNKYDPIFCVVDLHAITVPQKPEELRRKTLEVAKTYLAAGIDPEKSTIFVQSHVPEHAELAWILNTITKVSELERMTQFKDKSGVIGLKKISQQIKNVKEKHKIHSDSVIKLDKLVENLTKDNKEIKDLSRIELLELINNIWNMELKSIDLSKLKDHISIEDYKYDKTFEKALMGLFNYPVLMAADILLYDTNIVPVGEDQLQHVEMTRTLARRFNTTFGETFVIPDPHVVKEGMRIMGLDDPAKKMSKSAASEYNYIALTDTSDEIREKIKRAVTDSGKQIRYSDDQPAIKNLLNIYALLDNATPKEIAESYRGKGYAEFKKDLAEVVVGFLEPFQEKYSEIDDREVLRILEEGKEKAKKLAREKMEQVKENMGLLI